MPLGNNCRTVGYWSALCGNSLLLSSSYSDWVLRVNYVIKKIKKWQFFPKACNITICSFWPGLSTPNPLFLSWARVTSCSLQGILFHGAFCLSVLLCLGYILSGLSHHVNLALKLRQQGFHIGTAHLLLFSFHCYEILLWIVQQELDQCD
jgi:hypothetical protein